MPPEDTVSTLVGTGTAGRARDGATATEAAIAEPFGVVVGPDRAIYFCDLGNHRICRVDAVTGTLGVVAGCGEAGHDGDGGPAIEARLHEPYEVRFDAAGNLYLVDRLAHAVRRVNAHGVIETLAGTGAPGFGGDGGPARAAALREPHSIEIGADGSVYIADIGNHRLRRIDLRTGSIETFAGTGETGRVRDGADIAGAPLHGPRALAVDAGGDLLLTLREGNAVYRIDMRSRTIHHLAGTGEAGYAGDGADAREARLAGPKGITVDATGIYIADTESHTVRRIDPASGTIATVLGDGRRRDGPDGAPLGCGLARPHGVFADNGRLLVGDTDNHRVRVLEAGSPS